MPTSIDWPLKRPRPRRRRFLILLAAIAVIVLGSRTALSYFVDLLWFRSLGYESVFSKTLLMQWIIFLVFSVATFLILYGSFAALRRSHLPDLPSHHTVFLGGQPVKFPVEPVLRFLALGGAIAIGLITGAGMMAEWPSLALYWYAPAATGGVVDPVFGKPLNFFLFTLPAWQLISGWLLTLAIMVCFLAVFFVLITGGAGALSGRRSFLTIPWRGLSIAFAFLLLILAIRVYLDRFGLLVEDHTVFSGVTYTDAHITITGLLLVSIALLAGAVAAAANAVTVARGRWLVAAIIPVALCFAGVRVADWWMSSFIVKPNELVRERPYIANNIQMTRQAFGLDRFSRHEFPAETTVEAADPANNQATLQNIRLWDWQALQDTLRQIQEIRTYYDFPDIDIDRYEIGGELKQVMLATRELNVDKLPESSMNWINEKLIYTHGYGITMNPVNGFTPEGLPVLYLSNMPVQSTVPGLNVTRPEIYFGELTDTDVYVKTRQQEFNYPQGQSNNLNSYQGTGGIVIGGMLRRILLAIDRGDLGKLPFSDDVTSQSRLLMRRNVRVRVNTLAPFLTYDPDPYIVVGEDGKLSWVMDGFTSSDQYPYSTHYQLGEDSINYMRNSVKVVIDAYDGTVTFYVFDDKDPIIAAWRRIFPSLFKDAAAMPAGLRKHMRYPEQLLKMQGQVYGLYHMTNPEVFYNREDLWTVASEVGMSQEGGQTTQPMQPNYVLMKLPDGKAMEFVAILPFTPANRNNLIGWVGGRSDGVHYGTAVVYDFPKNRLVDGPLQIEARIDQNAQLSGQLTLWNQQGSHVRRGTLLVIPTGRALLYAEPIYLQAERSPMPELRLVVLALQDRLVYASTYEAALTALFGSGGSSLAAPEPAHTAPAAATGPQPATDLSPIIQEAARDLSDYQRLTAEGKLGEAGQKLEDLKRALGRMSAQK
ncbi:MAG TPA: UPF0182 family protein [Acidobacteriaceae bacterium]|nr:UPF0182 family protein [Acidobacteriaceae bacterium]